MHLYVMHKREVLVTLAGFVSAFILLLFIGLAGPNVSRLDVTKASEIFTNDNINDSISTELLQTGPFALYTPAMSTYSQHLTLYVTFFLKNEESSETFNTDFVIALRIEGLTENDPKNKVEILNEDINMAGGRMHHLFCSVKKCNPIQVFHLEFLEYQHYDFEVTFRKLESVHKKYGISDIRFSFQSINSSFTTLTIWFRFVFLATAFAVTVSMGGSDEQRCNADSLQSAIHEKWMSSNMFHVCFSVLVHALRASVPVRRMVHGTEMDRNPFTSTHPLR